MRESSPFLSLFTVPFLIWGKRKWKSCPTLCDPMDYTAFSRPEYWSGEPFPSPRDLPNPGVKPRSPALPADSLPAKPQGKQAKLQNHTSMTVPSNGTGPVGTPNWNSSLETEGMVKGVPVFKEDWRNPHYFLSPLLFHHVALEVDPVMRSTQQHRKTKTWRFSNHKTKKLVVDCWRGWEEITEERARERETRMHEGSARSTRSDVCTLSDVCTCETNPKQPGESVENLTKGS